MDYEHVQKTMTAAEIRDNVQKAGRKFNRQNKLTPDDIKPDHLQTLNLSQEFFKLAHEDLKFYEKQLVKRLQEVPASWKNQGS